MSINIEEIMSEIRADIREKGLTGDMLSFADIPCEANPRNRAMKFDSDKLSRNVAYISDNYLLITDNKITGNPISRFFKKAIRKLIRFYTDPIAADQTALNANTAQAIQELELYIIDSQTQSSTTIVKRLDELELQQRNNRMEIDHLQKQVLALREQLEAEREAKL